MRYQTVLITLKSIVVIELPRAVANPDAGSFSLDLKSFHALWPIDPTSDNDELLEPSKKTIVVTVPVIHYGERREVWKLGPPDNPTWQPLRLEVRVDNILSRQLIGEVVDAQ